MGRQIYSSITEISALTGKTIEKYDLGVLMEGLTWVKDTTDYFRYYTPEGNIDKLLQMYMWITPAAGTPGAVSGSITVELSANIPIFFGKQDAFSSVWFEYGELRLRANYQTYYPLTDELMNGNIAKTRIDSDTYFEVALTNSTDKDLQYDDFDLLDFVLSLERERTA